MVSIDPGANHQFFRDAETLHLPSAIPGEMVYPRECIHLAVAGLAEEVAEWIAGADSPVLPVIVMKGGVFFGTKLLQAVSRYTPAGRLKDYIPVTAHRSTGIIEGMPPGLSFEGLRVLFIDEICDGGDTIHHLFAEAKNRGAESTEAVTLITRASAHYKPRWTGFTYGGPEWFIGEGLDNDGEYRALEDIYVLVDQEETRLQGMLSGLSELREKHPELSFAGMDRFLVSKHFPGLEASIMKSLCQQDMVAEGERALIAWEEMIEEMRRSGSWNGHAVPARIPQREVTARGLFMADVASRLLYDLSEAARKEGHEVYGEGVYFCGGSMRGKINTRDFDISLVVSTPSPDVRTHEAAHEFAAEYAAQVASSSEYAGLGLQPQIDRMKWLKGGFKVNTLVGSEPNKNRPSGSGTTDYRAKLAFFRARKEEGDLSLRPLTAVFTPLTDFEVSAIHNKGKEI